MLKAQESALSVPSNNLSVLVVDSETLSRNELTAHLKHAVTTVNWAKNGSVALDIIQKKRPDIIITDLILPDMDGLEYLTLLRKIDAEVPVMVIYDGYNPSMIIKSLDHNVSGFIKKPYDMEKLFQQLWRVAKEVLLRQKLHETKSMLERVLDFFPAYVLLAEEQKVSFVNRKLLDFLGFQNYSEMREQDVNLDDFIKEVNDVPYVEGQGKWIHSILNDPLDREHMIRMTNPRHPEEEGRAFSVQFNEFHHHGVYLFTFSDISDLQRDRSIYEDQASIDPLTGAYNRRKFLELLAIQEMYMATSGIPLSVIMFDIDHFKMVNDTYGHDVGDTVLKEICMVARNSARDNDQLGRWGGEEFMVLLSGADLRQARALAERLRIAVESFDFTNVPDGCTSSFSVGQWQQQETRAAFLKRLDKALYEAKETGRNKVVVA